MTNTKESAEIILLEVDDLVQDVFQNRFGLRSVLHLLRHSQDISRLTHKILQVPVLALVR